MPSRNAEIHNILRNLRACDRHTHATMQMQIKSSLFLHWMVYELHGFDSTILRAKYLVAHQARSRHHQYHHIQMHVKQPHLYKYGMHVCVCRFDFDRNNIIKLITVFWQPFLFTENQKSTQWMVGRSGTANYTFALAREEWAVSEYAHTIEPTTIHVSTSGGRIA